MIEAIISVHSSEDRNGQRHLGKGRMMTAGVREGLEGLGMHGRAEIHIGSTHRWTSSFVYGIVDSAADDHRLLLGKNQSGDGCHHV